MNKYKHLSLEEREVIKVGLELGKTHRAIAKEMGRDRVVCAWMMDEYESKIG